MAAIHREAIQKQIQQDWANREYIEVITGSIKKITDFLNSFGNNQIIELLSFYSHIHEANFIRLVDTFSCHVLICFRYVL